MGEKIDFSGVCLFRNPLRAVAKIIIFNWDYHLPLLIAIYLSDSCVTDAHCFLFAFEIGDLWLFQI